MDGTARVKIKGCVGLAPLRVLLLKTILGIIHSIKQFTFRMIANAITTPTSMLTIGLQLLYPDVASRCLDPYTLNYPMLSRTCRNHSLK
jgi:hypothetical protein